MQSLLDHSRNLVSTPRAAPGQQEVAALDPADKQAARLDRVDQGVHQHGVGRFVERAPETHPDLEHQLLELAGAQLLALPAVQAPEPASGG